MKKIFFCILILLGFGDIFCSDFSLELHPVFRENREHLYNVIKRNTQRKDLANIIAWGAQNGMRGVDALAKINSSNISLNAFLQINKAVLQTFNRNEDIYWEAFEAVNQRGYTFVRISHDYLTGTSKIEELLPIVYYDNYYRK